MSLVDKWPPMATGEDAGLVHAEQCQAAYEALNDYATACDNLNNHVIAFESVFAIYEALKAEKDDAEAALKEAARAAGEKLETERFTVTVQTKARRWYDAETVLDMAPYVRDIPGVMVMAVDSVKINALAKSGMLPEDVVKAAYREEMLTSAVSIKEK